MLSEEKAKEKKARIKEQKRLWWLRKGTKQTPEKKAYMDKWRAANGDKLKQYAHDRWINHKQLLKDQRRNWWRKVREEVISAYGGECVCCGEARLEFLALDHIHDDGKVHRASFGVNGTPSTNIYIEARRLGFPKDRLQVLCHNCNIAKSFYGGCPESHRKINPMLLVGGAC